MFDLKLIRDNPDQVRESLAHRKDTASIDEIIKLDQDRRQKLTQLEASIHNGDISSFNDHRIGLCRAITNL